MGVESPAPSLKCSGLLMLRGFFINLGFLKTACDADAFAVVNS